MSKETREHLSALVDGEISRETSRFLVRRLGTDSELRATWTRYHLVRDCLRHQDGAIAGDDLCARISRELENEQVITSSPVASIPVAEAVGGHGHRGLGRADGCFRGRSRAARRGATGQRVS